MATPTERQARRENVSNRGEANHLIRIVESMDDAQLIRLRAALNGEVAQGAPKRAYAE
jgi:hypothetical protein